MTELSGRGIGLDAVSRVLGRLHGRLRIATQAGRGTRFTLSVPLTLGAFRALLLVAGGHLVGLAETSVERVVLLSAGDLRTIGGREVAAVGEELLPVASLAALLGLPPQAQAPGATRRPAVLVAAADARLLLVAEAVLGEQEVAAKALGPRIRSLPHVASIAALGDGKLVPILNTTRLAASAHARREPLGAAIVQPRAPRSRKVLLAEDSVTTRLLEQHILETAGYEVVSAPDGAEAWRRLQEGGADVVVTDVQMPGMDGFELTRAIRASPRFADLPVVLVTGLGSDADRLRGVEVGASLYLVKSAFDQQALLAALERLLG